jgi:hypothetical protein
MEGHPMQSNSKSVRSGWLQAAIVLAAVSAVAVQLGATTLVQKNFDDLVTEADAIVVGTVSEAQAVYAADKRINTLVTLSDLQVLHGRYEGTSLTVQLPGGSIENDVMFVHGSPRLAAKERVVLFLRGNGRETVPVVGWTQGVFRIERDAKTGRQKVTDHERNPVLAVRGSDVVRQQINAPEATIVADPAKAQGVRGGGGKQDGAGSPAAAAAQLAAAGREAIDADVFIRAVISKVQEKRAVGRAVQSVGAAAAADIQPGQDAQPPQR